MMDKTQQRLGQFTGFNRPGIEFIRDHFLKGKEVSNAFKNKIREKTSESFRILDIGCGDFPYLKEDVYSGNKNVLSVFCKNTNPCIKIQLIDINEPNIPTEWDGFTESFNGCFFDYYSKWNSECKKFDLIILSAVAHELYLKWCFARISGQDIPAGREKFCQDLFAKLYELVDEGGLVLFAENYTPKRISRELQLRARKKQWDLIGNHADSPSAFFPTEEYVEAAEKVGFECVEQDSVRCISSEKYDNCDEAIKSALKARRFGCKLLRKKSQKNGFNTNNSNSLRRGFVFDMSEEGNLNKVDEVLKKCIKSPEKILNEYAKVFWGDNGVFKHLVKRSFEVVSNFFEYEDISNPELFSCWVSINSLVVKDRVCPKDNNAFTPILRKGEDIEVYSRSEKDKDWNEIAFNFLSSNEAFKTLFKDCSVDFLKESRGPSVYNYIKSNTSIRSLTITYARESHYEDPAINLSMQEDAINALDLEVLQEKTAKGNDAKHRLIVLNFPVNNSDNEVNSYLNVAAHINQLLGGSYYVDIKDKDYIKYLTAIYLDFLFLRRFENIGNTFIKALIGFCGRWNKALRGKKRCVVYASLRKMLGSAVKVVKAKNFDFNDLPRAFITYSSPSYWHTDENSISDLRKQSPGSLMIFSDKIFPKDVLDSMVAVTERTFDVVRAIELKWVEEKQRQNLEKANIKSAVGSIMSRNGSHNIGSHVLAALSHNVGTLPDDRVLYQYIQQRMDYIATVTTDFPTWTQPTMFVADMMKTFLSQRHLLDHIVESEGLRAFQFQNPNMDDDEWFDQKNCIQIHVRRVGADGEDGIDIIRYDSKDDRTKPLDLKQDIPLAIPGGIVGEHAFYTILENIIRNAAKHSWVSPSLDRKKYSNLKLYIDFWTTNNDSKVNFKIFARVPLNTEESDKTQGSSDSQKIGQLVDKFDSSQGLTNEDQNAFDSLPIDCRQQIMLTRRLIDSHGALRRENWGLAEMKISAGYLAGKEFDVIGGLKKSESEIIKPCVIEESKAFASEENKDAKEKYLGYTFSVEKPKEILIVVESLEGWNAEALALKEYGIFVKTVAEITNDEQSRRLNYRFVVHYDASQLFDNEKKPKNGILPPFRILSGKNVDDEKYKTFIPQISFDVLKGAFETSEDAIAKKNAVEKIVYDTYLKHLLEQRNKENQEKKIEEIKNIGLLVAINENEKAGGNSLISDADILELMLEQNFATCVDQYKAFVAGDDCKKIMRSLELIRCQSSDENKVVKFKKIKRTSTTKELIAQRIYDWMKLAGDDKDDIKEHLRKKYFVREKTYENYTDNFDDMVNALLVKHPIDDFIRYVEVIFENTKKLFKQYEEQIVTLPAGYKVETSKVEDGEVFIDGLKIITNAGAIKEDSNQKRHWIGYRRHAHTIDVEDPAKSLYVEPLSGTQTYLSNLAKVKNDLSLQMRLVENGLMRILVLDERVAKFLREHQKEVGPHYKAMNINVIDHEWVEGNNGDAPDGFYKAFTKDTKDALDQFVKSEEKNSSRLSKFTDVDILIVHQGILDKWFAGFKSDKEKMRKLLEGFKKLVKYVVVTTGRGTPDNIPEEAHLLPFAVVESTLFKKYPEKLILTDTIMNVLPVRKKNATGGQA